MKTNFFIIAAVCLLFIHVKDKSIVVSPDEYHAAVENVTNYDS
jgi:hypothetical protein